MLGVVFTCLSGSVWANEKLLSTKCSLQFCATLMNRVMPDKYDEATNLEEIENLCKLAKLGLNTENGETVLPEKLTGVAKVYLLEEMYKGKVITKDDAFSKLPESLSEPCSCHYFIAAHTVTVTHIVEMKTISAAEDYILQWENPVFYELSKANPMEAKAAELIDQCDELTTLKSGLEQELGFTSSNEDDEIPQAKAN
ncbi:hypothetical protein IWQ61_009852 [Dispira simplex]|nr:hypothetical protein IWQ61_009852 [Dispira simplex]